MPAVDYRLPQRISEDLSRGAEGSQSFPVEHALQRIVKQIKFCSFGFMAHPGGRPPVYNNPEELQTEVDKYFTRRRKKTMTGLAIALGFDSRQSLYDYQKREEFSYIINKALLRIENQYEENLHGNNVAGSIFVLKNMGWKDRSEVDHTTDGSPISPVINIQVVEPKTEEE